MAADAGLPERDAGLLLDRDTSFPVDRQRQIVVLLREKGRLDVGGAAQYFNVTPETIRRDLINLEREGFIHRVHGGAILRSPDDATLPPLPLRTSIYATEKDAIARQALSHLPQRGAVLLDAGSTVGRLAEVFPTGNKVLVVTNSLPTAIVLAAKPGLTVHTLGGRVGPITLDEVGTAALTALSEMSVDVAFIGADGVSAGHGISTPEHAQSSTKRAMIRAAKKSIVLADSSKLGIDYFSRVATLREVDLLITDDNADPDLVEQLRATGLNIEVASRNPHQSLASRWGGVSGDTESG
jgi:DeoR family transcriptional regulator, fructose operon transcriptional repressor